MRWLHPHWLLWGLPALLLSAALLRGLLRRRRRQLEQMAGPAVQHSLLTCRRPRTGLRLGLRLTALLFILLALARPQWGFHWEEVRQRGLNIIVAVDTSKSMLAEDLKPNRLQQTQWALRDLVHQLHGDRIGLVAFAGSAFLQCPLTVDYAAFLMQLDDLYAGIIPHGGTDTAGAIDLALQSFEKESAADNVIILISDGESHEGDPLKKIDELKKAGVRVFTIGVGTPEGELIPIRDRQGRVTFLKDREGRTVQTRLQEAVLRDLALQTDGLYVRAASGDFGLEAVYRQGIMNLKKDEQESRMAKVYEERFGLFILAALGLLAMEALCFPKGGERP
jgi:Ca-activated chloride channel family protein